MFQRPLYLYCINSLSGFLLILFLPIGISQHVLLGFCLSILFFQFLKYQLLFQIISSLCSSLDNAGKARPVDNLHAVYNVLYTYFIFVGFNRQESIMFFYLELPPQSICSTTAFHTTVKSGNVCILAFSILGDSRFQELWFFGSVWTHFCLLLKDRSWNNLRILIVVSYLPHL